MLITVYTTCPVCGKESYISVNSEDFEAWQNGALIQKAMPYLSSSEREALISGVCPNCWDRMFGEEPEEEEGPEEFDYDFADTYMEMGFNPYMGCYDEDC